MERRHSVVSDPREFGSHRPRERRHSVVSDPRRTATTVYNTLIYKYLQGRKNFCVPCRMATLRPHPARV